MFVLFLLSTAAVVQVSSYNCPRENGYCVHENGRDQNSGVIKMNRNDGNSEHAQRECLRMCMERRDATGCEVIWSQGNRGCYIHTQHIARGNGRGRHYCWVFSKCRIDGQWSGWRQRSGCSRTCGGGTKQFYRQCDNPRPRFRGQHCHGPDHKNELCNVQSCPVDGQWSVWMERSGCSTSCGGGTKQFYRQCDNPKPSFGGQHCHGPDHKTEPCNVQACPVPTTQPPPTTAAKNTKRPSICRRDFVKKGCVPEDTKDLEQLLNHRPKINWSNYPVTVDKLLCDCVKLARAGGYSFIKLRFWGECWGGKDRSHVMKYFNNNNERCSGVDYKPCNDMSDKDCVGTSGSGYVYYLS